MSTEPVLSLVTGVRNRPKGFQRLLASIVAHTGVSWELVVGDASDTLLVCDDARVRILRESPRLGHTKGYNRCFRECRGEWVLWLNDDAEVCDGYAAEAIAFMKTHPAIGLGALYYSENGGPFRVNSAWGTLYANFGILQRSLGDQVDWFDEELVMYGADNSLALRALMAGKGIAGIEGARVLHHSELDAVRRENQVHRISDNLRLTQKYMPLRRSWLATYQRFAVRSDTDRSWPHGQRPALVHP